jgi:hypothetical protein
LVRASPVIYESHYWKDPLLKAANWLQRMRLGEKSAERALVRVERELFVGFYAIRKLLDTFKVSPKTRKMSFDLQWARNLTRVDYMNSHRITELYDIENMSTETRTLTFLCNQFVHSYVFSPLETEDGRLAGVFVASDRLRHEKLYLVSLDQVLTAFAPWGVTIRQNNIWCATQKHFNG